MDTVTYHRHIIEARIVLLTSDPTRSSLGVTHLFFRRYRMRIEALASVAAYAVSAAREGTADILGVHVTWV